MSEKMITQRILAFDPAAGKTGWAMVIYTPSSGKFRVTHTGLISGDKAMRELTKHMLPEFTRQFTVLMAIRMVVITLIRTHHPSAVVSESPFAHRFPAAFASLTLVVDRIRQACHTVLNHDIRVYPPMEVKKMVTGKGTADKDKMRSAILSNKKITFDKQVKRTDLTEHEYDAVGVAYTHGMKKSE